MMKFGYIIHTYGEKTKQYAGFNIGDPIQTYALLYLYDLMGIPKEDRIAVHLCDLNSYDGDYVILPTCSIALGIQFSLMPFSPKIIPVFISSHIAKGELSNSEIEYLKKYEPIGCRDEHSLNLCRKNGILAYMSGCIVAILPKRFSKTGKYIYMIDTPKSLDQFIPTEYLPYIKRTTHLLPLENDNIDYKKGFELFDVAVEILNEYRDNAILIVSSRMHALLPAIAMGIPAIGVFENISYRFSAFDKFIELYTEENFQSINWKPKAIDYEKEKSIIINAFKKQINDTFERYKNIYDVSIIYENRKKSNYGSRYKKIISSVQCLKKFNSYIIWGCGLIGDVAYEIMTDSNPKIKLVCAVDSFSKGEWHGVPIIHPDDLVNYSFSFIILATFSGREDGYNKMKELGKKENEDFIYIASQNG